VKCLSLLLLFLVLSCTPTYLIKKVPKKELSTRNVAMIPFFRCHINYLGDVETEFGKGDKNVLIQQYLDSAVANKLRQESCFKSVLPCSSNTGYVLLIDSIKGSDGTVVFLRPTDSTNVCGSDIVLTISDLVLFSQTIVHLVYFVPVIERALNFRCSYAYWDQKSKTLLSCGKIKQESTQLGPVLTMRSWNNLVESIVDELLVSHEYSKP
jgi:hypothetical protein